MQMLERESNKEKNLEKAMREAKIKARKEAAAKDAADKEKIEDSEDLAQVTALAAGMSGVCADVHSIDHYHQALVSERTAASLALALVL